MNLILSLQQTSKFPVFSISHDVLSVHFLRKSKWLLSIPVVSGGSDSKTGLWVEHWLFGEHGGVSASVSRGIAGEVGGHVTSGISGGVSGSIS